MGKTTVYNIRDGVIKNKNLFARIFLPVLVLSLAAVGLLTIPSASGAPPPPTITASVDLYSQCANDLGSGYTSGDLGCEWTNGNLQHNNSTYHEGDATPQRLAVKDLTNGSHTITFSYDTTKSGKHAYDFLTDDKYSESWIANADMCDPSLSNFASCSTATAVQSGAIPSDPNALGHDTAVAPQHFTIRNGTIINVGTPTLASGTYAGDSDTTIQVTFSVSTATCLNKYQVQGVDVCEALITFGAHISTQADWGAGTSAVNITGSPYHVALVNLDGSSIGQRDNQMQAGAIAQTPVVTTELHNDANEAVIPLSSSVSGGTSLHDKAIVAKTGNSNAFPTGTVTFRFYNTSNDCTSDTTFSGGVTKGTITLVSGVAHPSTASGALSAGTYAFKAKYNSSDISVWTDSISSCEVFTVNQGNSIVATTLKDGSNTTITEGSSVPLGTVVHDSATVTLTPSAAPNGSVSFKFYSSVSACNADTNFTGGTDKGTVALVGTPGVASPSTDTGALGAGTYAFKASWPGNANYAGNTSSCETFTVNKAQLSVSTVAHDVDHNDITNSSVALGSVTHDTATVSGGVSGFAVPTPTFTLTSNYTNSCTSGSAVANDGTELSGAAKSADSSALGAGTYAYRASVASNDNYLGNDSSCEPFTVNKVNLGIATTIHSDNPDQALAGDLSLGSGAHDSASVTGKVGSIGLPDVTFYFFGNGVACTDGSTTGGTQLNTVTPNGSDVAHPSTSETSLAAGTYNFIAVVAGDSNYNGKTSNCEPFTVDKSQLSMESKVHDSDHNVVTSVPLGSVVHDTAKLSGGTVNGFTPAAITFKFYSNDSCSGGADVTNTGADAGDSSRDRSADSSALAAGPHSYQAFVAGNDNYLGTNSGCEPFTVNQGTLTLATTVHTDDPDAALVGDAALGSSLHDSASVGGINANFAPANNVTFRFYNNSGCTGDGVAAGSVTIVNGVAHPSTSEGPLAAGAHAFRAFYDGSTDINYGPDSLQSDCEPFTVDKADLNIGTTVHSDTPDQALTADLALGSGAHDSASVTGKVGTFTLPDVTFYFFAKGVACADGDTTGSTALNTVSPNGSGVAHPSDSKTSLAAGTYNFMAVVAGDSNYNGKTSSCEPFTVDKAQLTVTTKVHDVAHNDITGTSVVLGSVTHDTATVAGNVDGFTVPDVSFTLTTGYTNSCANGDAVANNGTDGGAVRSADSASLTAGDYAYHATIAGNDNYIGDDSSCEPFTINQAGTSVSTAIHAGSNHSVDVQDTTIPLNSSIHDKATVSGKVGSIDLTGTLTYNFYKNNSCDGTPFATDSDVALGDESFTQNNLTAGDYSFLASYGGDNNYTGSTGSCEKVKVDKSSLGISTTIHDAQHAAVTSLGLGSIVHDTANVSGQVGSIVPTGAVTFYFGPGVAGGDCHNTDLYPVIATAASPDVGNGNPRSIDTSALSAGTYQFWAHVAGDSNYTSADSTCEPLTVNKVNLDIATRIHTDSPDQALVDNLGLGGSVHDSAKIKGKVASYDLPNVTFYFFAKGVACTNGSVTGATALNTLAPDGSGVAHPSTSQTNLAAGTYNFMAVVAGNSNYNGDTSDCEPFTVDKAQLSISTNVHNPAHQDITNTSVALGAVTHDTAAVTGGVGGFSLPAVSFTLTSGYTESCASGSAVANNGTESGATKSADSTALVAGHYAYRAVVADSSNYVGATGICEPFNVNKASLTVTTDIHNAAHVAVTSINAGGTVHDQANVGGLVGGIAPVNNITFTFYRGGNCINGTPESAGSHAIVAGVAHPSDNKGPLDAGSYAFKASYDGSTDPNYTSADATCEPLTVNPVTPSIDTTASAGGVVGVQIHDSATVTGGYNPTGTVTFYLFGPGDNCSDNTTNLFAETKTLSGGSAGPTSNYTTLAVGTYHWEAVYSGDSNNNTVTSPCANEAVTTTKASPSVATITSAGGLVGTILNDTATLSGGNAPTGSVTFKLFPPSDASCSGTASYTFTDPSAPYATSPGFTSNAAGVWHWTAHYVGDANNNPADSSCSSEAVTITAPVLFWCSPGFWAQAYEKNRTGVLAYLANHGIVLTSIHYSTVKAWGGAALSKKAPANPSDPTLAQVLSSPNLYGGPAFNSVSDYIASRLGWSGTQNTGENCPLDAHGNLTLSVLTI